ERSRHIKSASVHEQALTLARSADCARLLSTSASRANSTSLWRRRSRAATVAFLSTADFDGVWKAARIDRVAGPRARRRDAATRHQFGGGDDSGLRPIRRFNERLTRRLRSKRLRDKLC